MLDLSIWEAGEGSEPKRRVRIMNTTEAERLYVTAVRLVRSHAEHLPLLADDGPRRVTGLMMEALLAECSVPQAIQAASARGVPTVDEVRNLLRHLKDNVWDTVAAESGGQ